MPEKSLFGQKYFSLFLTLVFSLIVLVPSVIFFLSQLVEAYRFPMWQDEQFGLTYSIRSHSYLNILVRGAQGQGSPSPLDYLINKFVDQIRVYVNQFNLPSDVYFRLFSNFITSATSFFVVLSFAIDIIKEKSREPLTRLVQCLILTVVPTAFLFEFQIFKYAHEMRPYALWNSLYFISLCSFLIRDGKHRLISIFFLVLLSMSSTASLFQIGAIFLSFVLVELIRKRRVGDVLLSGAKLFTIPFGITFYYCLQAGQWGYAGAEWGAWKDFYAYWEHFLFAIPMMMGAAVLCLAKPDTKCYAVVPLSFLLIYLAGPGIFLLTKWRGFFYADRQYLYYELARPLFLLIIVRCLPALTRDLPRRLGIGVLMLAVALSGALGLRSKFIKRMMKSSSNAVELIQGKVF